jgi:YegS/Rv2252/BmrU family lipid kinase
MNSAPPQENNEMDARLKEAAETEAPTSRDDVPSAPPEVLIVILNPASGTVKNESKSGAAESPFRERVEAALKARGAQFEIRETTPEIGADVLARQAAHEGEVRILVCGGDGTVMAAVNGLSFGQDEAHAAPGEGADPESDERPVLSIVPGGTANLIAAALEIPTDIEEAVEIALTGVERDIDLGRCGPHVFALGLGLGLTEKLISKTSAREKETLGKMAYAKAMLREIGADPTRFRFQIDDGPEQTSSGVGIVIANAGRIGGALHFAPDALMDDGVLDLCILHRFEWRDVARMVAKMLVGSLPEDRAVTFLQGKTIKILSEPPLDLQIDGEEVEESTPLTAEVLPGALRVRVTALSDLKMEGEKIEKEAPHLVPPRSNRWLAAGAIGAAALGLLLWKRRQK